MASETQGVSDGRSERLPAYLTAGTKIKTTMREQWSMILIVALAAWWVRDGLSKIEHAIDRLNDRVGFIDQRVADHESRIRVVERPK